MRKLLISLCQFLHVYAIQPHPVFAQYCSCMLATWGLLPSLPLCPDKSRAFSQNQHITIHDALRLDRQGFLHDVWVHLGSVGGHS